MPAREPAPLRGIPAENATRCHKPELRCAGGEMRTKRAMSATLNDFLADAPLRQRWPKFAEVRQDRQQRALMNILKHQGLLPDKDVDLTGGLSVLFAFIPVFKSRRGLGLSLIHSHIFSYMLSVHIYIYIEILLMSQSLLCLR